MCNSNFDSKNAKIKDELIKKIEELKKQQEELQQERDRSRAKLQEILDQEENEQY